MFFRTVKVEGDELLPTDHAYIVALNHPNGLVDPGLVLVTAEAPISFLAKCFNTTKFGIWFWLISNATF